MPTTTYPQQTALPMLKFHWVFINKNPYDYTCTIYKINNLVSQFLLIDLSVCTNTTNFERHATPFSNHKSQNLNNKI